MVWSWLTYPLADHGAPQLTSENPIHANFGELRDGEVQHSPTPIGLRDIREGCPHRQVLCARCKDRGREELRASGRGGGKRKAGPPWRGGYRQARLNNNIVTRCNALINLCICRKWAFSSQRACALIPPWRGMGDPRVASPIVRRSGHPSLAASGWGEAKGRSPLT
jgi:hypothetical protein